MTTETFNRVNSQNLEPIHKYFAPLFSNAHANDFQAQFGGACQTPKQPLMVDFTALQPSYYQT